MYPWGSKQQSRLYNATDGCPLQGAPLKSTYYPLSVRLDFEARVVRGVKGDFENHSFVTNPLASV